MPATVMPFVVDKMEQWNLLHVVGALNGKQIRI